ncbi:MAG: NanQ anomerase/TabA/YiaL family protein [Planctomycetota bacterium]|jgi:YhcH/YjgK/YiaL family protein
MIVDKIENAHLYSNISESLGKALKILSDKQIIQKEDGRYDVDGDNLFYTVQRYRTKPFKEGKLEAHKKYIDIQFITEGKEILGHTTIKNLQIDKPYDDQIDVAFYELPDRINKLNLTEGTFCILFPHDAHMPCRELNGPSNVLKVVVKVKVNAE